MPQLTGMACIRHPGMMHGRADMNVSEGAGYTVEEVIRTFIAKAEYSHLFPWDLDVMFLADDGKWYNPDGSLYVWKRPCDYDWYCKDLHPASKEL